MSAGGNELGEKLEQGDGGGPGEATKETLRTELFHPCDMDTGELEWHVAKLGQATNLDKRASEEITQEQTTETRAYEKDVIRSQLLQNRVWGACFDASGCDLTPAIP